VVDGNQLLALPLQAAAPAVAGATFYVVNSRPVARSLRHGDGVSTLYADLEFPAGSIATLDGAPVGPDDSVRVTVTAAAGRYGITLSPAGLAFASSTHPTLTLSYARYGDLSVATTSPRYADATAFAAALDLWREVGLNRWSMAAGSGPTGADGVTGRLATGGSYLAAAPR